MSLSSMLNSGKWKVEQFPPGHFAEYQLVSDGTARLIRQQKYYTIGAAPAFQTLIPYSGDTKLLQVGIDFLKNMLHLQCIHALTLTLYFFFKISPILMKRDPYRYNLISYSVSTTNNYLPTSYFKLIY